MYSCTRCRKADLDDVCVDVEGNDPVSSFECECRFTPRNAPSAWMSELCSSKALVTLRTRFSLFGFARADSCSVVEPEP
ncbi:hypothetical protein K443DRAFT_674813, partial [Laccaria amethystina LaAM-08-1]